MNMEDYLKFCWESLIHPTQGNNNILAPIQLILFFIFLYFGVKLAISIYQHYKDKKMAKSKKESIQGYFFMSVTDDELNLECTGDSDVLAAAFATLITTEEADEEGVKQILSNAVAIAAEHLVAKEKYVSKTAKKPVKKATKSAKKK